MEDRREDDWDRRKEVISQKAAVAFVLMAWAAFLVVATVWGISLIW